MAKIKVKKAAKKRYKFISQKKILRKRAFKSHLLEKKSSKRKRGLTKNCSVSSSNRKAIRYMLAC